MDYESVQILQHQLGPDEKLLWSGRPRRGILFKSRDFYLIPFGILGCGVSIYMLVVLIIWEVPFYLWMVVIPFFYVAFYTAFGRFIIDAQQRKKTIYGVTNERILIVQGLLSRNVKTLNLKALRSDIFLTEREDRSGTIIFGRGKVFSVLDYVFGNWMPDMKDYLPPCCESIENANDVYEIILTTQNILKNTNDLTP